MKINTKDFGELTIEESEVIFFPKGLFAFEEVKEFVLIEMDGYLQKWLQAVNDANPRLIVLNPSDILEGYEPHIPDEVLRELKIGKNDKYSIYVVAVIPENIKNMTVNLKSPIIVNYEKRLAAQGILEKEDLPIRYRVFQEKKGGF